MESYRTSLHDMKAETSEEQQRILDLALVLVRAAAFREMDQEVLSTTLKGQTEGISKPLFEAIKEKLDGKTAQQILDLALEELATFSHAADLGRYSGRIERLSVLLTDAIIAEKRASIESTDDQTLKEQRRRELQSLLEFKADQKESRENVDDGGRFTAGGYIPSDDWTSTELITLNLGDRGYLVPRNYVSHINWSGSKTHHTSVVLNVLWPGMEPRTEKNRRDWRLYDQSGVKLAEWNPKRLIRIFLTPPGRRASEGYRSFQNARMYFSSTPKATTFGLTPYERELGMQGMTYYVAESDPHQSPLNRPLVLECQKAREHFKKSFDVEMGCEVRYVLESGAGLRYSFYTKNLADWKERDIAVRELVNAFRTPL